MGPSCCRTIKNSDQFDDFNQKYLSLDIHNTTISVRMIECTLHHIGQIGFDQFCELNLKNIKILYLGNNEISKITSFKKSEFPNLEKLSLDRNKIINVEIFGMVNYPLEYLDLTYNMINDISIFSKEEHLPKLKKLLLSNNDFNSNDENTKNILSKIKEKINKNKNSEIEYSVDDSYQKLLKNIKTLNSKYIDESKDNIGIFDEKEKIKQSIEKIKTKKNVDKEDEQKLDDLVNDISQIKKSAKFHDDSSVNNEDKSKKDSSPLNNEEQ